MAAFQAQNSDFEASVREIFDRQGFMRTLQAELVRVEPGEAEIVLPVHHALLQHHGFLHGGAIATVLDTACGCAAGTLMPAGSTLVTVEYKVNFLAPATGTSIRARGRVLRPGRQLTVCYGEAVELKDGAETRVAVLTATMMRLAAPTE